MWMYLINVLLVVGVKEPVQSTPIGIQGYTINPKQVRSRNIVKTTKAHPWNIKRMPWWYHMVGIVCIVWLTAGEYDMTHHTGLVNQRIWSRGATPKGDSRMRWNIQRRLVTLSNDMEYDQKMWNDSQWRIRMAHDVHPNPGPPTAPPPDELTCMTRNVWGPHISKKRWARLLTEMEEQQPVCVGLQEVRFRSGSNHMALTSQLLHTYVPMYHRTQTADVMMLIHNRISPYVTMLPSCTPHAMAVRVELPGRLLFTVINHHGRVTKKDRVIMDEWFKTIPEVGVFMGDLCTCGSLGNVKLGLIWG